MGNEGSMPQTEEEFERQARAPPTASPPSGQPPQPPTPSHGGRGGRMMNAVFHRRQNNAANSTHNEYHPQPGVPQLQAEDMVMMSTEQQQQYYQEQQAMYMQTQYNTQAPDYPADPNSHSNPSTPTRKGLGFRPSGRAGAAIINSMKNLSLGTGVLGRNSNNVTKMAATEKEWETRWDEDDEEDDEEDDDDAGPSDQVDQQGSHRIPQHASPNQKSNLKPPPHATASSIARPGMDGSISSPPRTTRINGHASPDAMLPGRTSGTPTKAHLVTATPEQPGVEDGVEWDTGLVESEAPGYEKPNVKMFLPLLRVLGKGSFGKVVLAQKRVGKEKGQLFAMKILRKSHLVRRRQIERTRTERKVLSVVNHPFIMKLHYAFQTPDKLYLVLDYCPGGELFFHLSRFRRFPERVARFYAAELLLALGHLHKRGIIYRDLKPENVLLDADGHVKLGDFGLAKAGIQHACEGATSMCGTPEYMAPEVLAQQGHGFCVDYWGLGMLVYEMMTGLPPWYTTDRTRLFRRLRSAPLDIPNYFSQSSAQCVSALLERNPRQRLGVTGIRAAMEHEFFRSINWRALYGRRVEAPIRPCEGWSPPKETGGVPPEQIHGDNPDLDAATANFDNTFTRMPVGTDDHPDGGNADDLEELEELHEDTFIGFTYDDTDQDDLPAAARQRTHHYGSNGDGKLPATGPARHLD